MIIKENVKQLKEGNVTIHFRNRSKRAINYFYLHENKEGKNSLMNENENVMDIVEILEKGMELFELKLCNFLLG